MSASASAKDYGQALTVRIWDNASAPHSNEDAGPQKEKNGNLYNTVDTELFIYPAAPDKATGQAVVVCPGGGYRFVSMPREGHEVGEWLSAEGITVVALKYRLPNGHCQVPLEDAEAALRYIRDHAAEYGVDPSRVGIMGFSAGGHLAASTAILWDAEPVQTALGIHGTEARPDAVVLGYPVITAGEYRHDGSIVNLCGDDADLRATMSLENQVRDGLPPFFVWHTVEDPSVPVQNSLMLAGALTAHKVPLELHLFAHDGHGTSTCTREVNTPNKHNSAWVALCTDWLAETFDFHL